jgi:hypothetical protein
VGPVLPLKEEGAEVKGGAGGAQSYTSKHGMCTINDGPARGQLVGAVSFRT